MKRNTSLPRLLRQWAFVLGLPALMSPGSWAQQVAAPSAAASGPTTAAPVVAAPTNAEEQVIRLSPFEVSVAGNRGYEASSTMSGTRLNSSLADLAASISVVTRQQLLDTASVDINDVFRYEANTEGIYQWTSFSNDRGTISDDIQANPSGATRIRGLTPANIANDGFASSLPFDRYNVDSLEITRGPNSSVFGPGNTGGGVNIIAAKANLGRNFASFGARGDSYGGYRTDLDINQALIQNRLAVRIMGLYNRAGYKQKPAHDTTRRLELALTYRPYKNTTIRGSFESYREFYNRPNSTTPRDGISDWIASGRPTYDPLTQTVHFLDGSAPITGVTSALEATRLPYGIMPSDTNFTTYPSWYIQNGRIELYEINAMPTATGTGPNSVNASGLHLLTSGTFYNRYSTQYPLYVTSGVTNKSIYDWTSVNITAPNYGRLKGETANFSLEQIILSTPRQTLAFQAAWQGQLTWDNNRSFLGTYGNAGGKLQVSIDINEKLLDGSANPYFLRPYLGYPRPGYKKVHTDSDNYRATLAYELNLTNEKNWLKWLGRHHFSGYGEYRTVDSWSQGFTDTLSSDESWISATGVSSSRNSASYRPYVHYLVGDANGYNVDYGAPGIAAPPFSTTLRYYNGVTRQWINEPVDYAEYYYANRPNRSLLSTYGFTWQGFLLNDRIVPTFGVRKDLARSHDANSATSPSTATDGFYDLSSCNAWTAYGWVPDPHVVGFDGGARTTTKGVVVKALPWVHLLYNQSDGFIPGSLAYDIYGDPLPNPAGQTRDYGFQFSFFNDRLSIRAVQYETWDGGRTTDSNINTYVQRALRLDYYTSATDPNLTGWMTTELQARYPTWTADQVAAEVVSQTGVDPNYIAGHISKTHGDTGSSTSRGKEFEIAFNPSRYWTLKSTITQTRAFNGVQLAQSLQQYIAERMPLWTTIRGPNSGNLWWTTPISGTTPQTFYINNVQAPIALMVATQGKRRTQTREWHYSVVTNYKLAGITNNRWLKDIDVGGAVRWEDKASIGYYGAAPDADGIVRTLDPTRPIWDKARYYVDLSAGYRFNLSHNKVRARVQLNIKDFLEKGRLQPVAINPDGSPFAFRIINPQQFIVSATFDL